MTTSWRSGGADIVWIPAGSILENVLIPPNPNFNDPDAGARPVEFDWRENRTPPPPTIFTSRRRVPAPLPA